jgi:hypothetical protein
LDKNRRFSFLPQLGTGNHHPVLTQDRLIDMYPNFYPVPHTPLLQQHVAPIIPQGRAENHVDSEKQSKYGYAYDDLFDRLNKIEKSVSRRDVSTLSDHQIGELVENVLDGERTCYQWADSFHKFGYHSSTHWKTAPCPDFALRPKPAETTRAPTTTMDPGPLCVDEEITFTNSRGKMGLNVQKVHRYTVLPCDVVKATKEKREKASGECFPS